MIERENFLTPFIFLDQHGPVLSLLFAPRLANDPAPRQWAQRGAAASASPTCARKMMALPGNPATDRMAARIEWPALARAVLQKERLHPIRSLPDQPRRRPTGSRFDPQSIS